MPASRVELQILRGESRWGESDQLPKGKKVGWKRQRGGPSGPPLESAAPGTAYLSPKLTPTVIGMKLAFSPLVLMVK